jgi:twinkle protein
LYDINQAGHDCIAFPFYDENDDLTYVQYRTIKQKGFFCSKDCKAILFGMWRIAPNTKTLFITEGPIDALSLATVGINNVVSVPNGCKNMNWLEYNWEWLQQFDEYFIFGDKDSGGEVMTKQLVDRLGIEKCFIVDAREKDANDVLQLHGEDALLTDCYLAKLVNLDTIQDFDPFEWNPKEKIECTYSGFKSLDDLIDGFRINEFTLWTGVTGHGKTTFLNHVILNMIHQGTKTLIYSGELSHQSLARTICLPCAGERNINDRQVTNETLSKIKEFTCDKLYRYKYEGSNSFSGKKSESRDILKDFEIAYKRYGIKIFIIDNLMTASS